MCESLEYDAFLGRKVAVARDSVRADRGRANDEVEASFVPRRAELLKKADETSA